MGAYAQLWGCGRPNHYIDPENGEMRHPSRLPEVHALRQMVIKILVTIQFDHELIFYTCAHA